MPGNLLDRQWTTEDLDLMETKAQVESYKSFWSYRQYLNHPHLIVDWWQREVALELHYFWLEYKAGRRPKLLLQSPPQHGKSSQVTDFLSWIIGHERTSKIIFASYSDRLGARTNLRLHRIFSNPRFTGIFGSVLSDSFARSNSEIIEFAGGEGYFRNTTIMGAVTGEGLEIGVIDDPIKGRAEASSPTIREKTWSWLTDDYLTRFADYGGLIMIMTRWHLDDPAGRMMERYPGIRVLRYPAIAEKDERHRFGGKRKAGEALFPRLKSMEFLAQQRNIMTQAGWESVYQQNPIIVGGDRFPIDKIEIIPTAPSPSNVTHVARYWDKSSGVRDGAFTAGVLMAKMTDGTFAVVDVRRGRWSALQRENVIKMTAGIDRKLFPHTKVYIEQEPGSGGKESAENTIRNLAGFIVEADRPSGDKEVRAEPFAAQWQAGNVRLVDGAWNGAYIDEHETFPNGKFKDQVDASSGAFNKLAGTRYLPMQQWVG